MYNNLKSLQSLSERNSQLVRPVVEKSLDPILDDFQKLAQGGFQDGPLAAQTAQKLAQTLQRSPQNAEANAYFAYVLTVFQEPLKALKYAHMAHQLEPEIDDYLSLVDWIQEELRGGDTTTETPEPEITVQDTEEVDLDDLYDQVEAFILEWVLQIMNQPPLQIALSDKALLELKRRHHELQQNYHALEDKIDQLEVEFETQPLKAKLKPIEIRQRQFQEVIRVSNQFVQLKKDIQKADESSQEVADRLQEMTAFAIQQAERQLESILDHCDKIADGLDSLDQNGQDISPIEPDYNGLVSAVQELQDKLEEKREELEG